MYICEKCNAYYNRPEQYAEKEFFFSRKKPMCPSGHEMGHPRFFSLIALIGLFVGAASSTIVTDPPPMSWIGILTLGSFALMSMAATIHYLRQPSPTRGLARTWIGALVAPCVGFIGARLVLAVLV